MESGALGRNSRGGHMQCYPKCRSSMCTSQRLKGIDSGNHLCQPSGRSRGGRGRCTGSVDDVNGFREHQQLWMHVRLPRHAPTFRAIQGSTTHPHSIAQVDKAITPPGAVGGKRECAHILFAIVKPPRPLLHSLCGCSTVAIRRFPYSPRSAVTHAVNTV